MRGFTKKKQGPSSPIPTAFNNDLDLEMMHKRKQDYLKSKEKEEVKMQMNGFKNKTMSPSSPISTKLNTDLDLETMLKKKLDYLNKKEKELVEMQKKLQKKMNQFNKKRHAKAKADLKAAKKLNRARKQLMRAVDVNEKVQKGSKKKKICTKCDPSQRTWMDKLHELYEKFVSCERCSCINKKKSAFSKMCDHFFKKVSGPCPCEEGIGDYCAPSRQTNSDLARRPKRYLDYPNDGCYDLLMGGMPARCYPPCPPIDPGYTDCRTQFRNMKYCMLYLASFLFWSPCLLTIILCKCFCCLCNSDC